MRCFVFICRFRYLINSIKETSQHLRFQYVSQSIASNEYSSESVQMRRLVRPIAACKHKNLDVDRKSTQESIARKLSQSQVTDQHMEQRGRDKNSYCHTNQK